MRDWTEFPQDSGLGKAGLRWPSSLVRREMLGNSRLAPDGSLGSPEGGGLAMDQVRRLRQDFLEPWDAPEEFEALTWPAAPGTWLRHSKTALT